MSGGADRDPVATAPAAEAHAISAWLVPAAAYVIIVGALGVATELALDELSWHQVLIWTAVAYLIVLPFLLLNPDARPRSAPGLPAAMLSGALAASSLVVLFVALSAGEVGQVIPVTSAYPVVTLALAFSFLSERVSPTQVFATALIIAGVALLSMT